MKKDSTIEDQQYVSPVQQALGVLYGCSERDTDVRFCCGEPTLKKVDSMYQATVDALLEMKVEGKWYVEDAKNITMSSESKDEAIEAAKFLALQTALTEIVKKSKPDCECSGFFMNI